MISGSSPPFISLLLKNNQMYKSRSASSSSSCALAYFHCPSLHWTVFNLLNLHVHFSLFLSLFFSWRLNGTEINPKTGSHYSLSGGNLRISHLNKDQDAGTYQCLASNSFGTIVSREASLTFACEFIFIFFLFSLGKHLSLLGFHWRKKSKNRGRKRKTCQSQTRIT